MKIRLSVSILIFVCLICFSFEIKGQNANFYLKNNDRVIFYGDSITEQSFYTNFVETYVATRFPNLNVGFTNSGWSGDKIWGGDGGSLDERLRRDVFPHQPTVITAMLGMNDGCYVEFNADCFKAYTENYGKFVELVKKGAPTARLSLFQPSPFDDWTDSGAWRLAPPVKNGYNNVLIRYGNFVKELAKKNNLNSADLNAPLVEAIKKAQTENRDLAQKIIPDRIHPGEAGGLLMANAILKSWNAPSLISKVEINAAAQNEIKTENAKVSELKISQTISWNQLDSALPMPIDLQNQTMALAVRLSDVEESLNQQILKVVNLKSTSYQLKIDGQTIGVLTQKQLSEGTNTAILPTPMFKQAQEIYRLTQEHNKVHFVRWREIQILQATDNFAGTAKILAQLDALENELIKRRKLAAQPKAHHYELVPVE